MSDNGEYLPAEEPRTDPTEIEKFALSSLFQGPDMAETWLPKMPAFYFADQRHKQVRWAMEQLFLDGKPIDTLLVCQLLKESKRIDQAGGIPYVASLHDLSPNALMLEHYVPILRRYAEIKKLSFIRTEIDNLLEKGTVTTQVINDARVNIEAVLDRADPRTRPGLTLRRPDEILAMRFPDNTGIVGGKMFSVGQPMVILGQGGIGKSRILLQLIACVVASRKFLTFDTGCSHLRWLVLQTENTNERLQQDLKAIHNWLGEELWRAFNSRVIMHALENDVDGFVALDLPENQAAVNEAIQSCSPDVVVFDPLNDFSIGDLNKDADMKATLQTIGKLVRKENHQRNIVLLHHSLTGKMGAAKATGYDRTSFGRNSKSLLAWTRAQINIAPVDEENNDRLIIACGKSSNTREFQPFAARLNHDTMLYECDPTVDVKEWASQINGKKSDSPITLDRIAELCRPLTPKLDLAKAIMADSGLSRPTAYRYIQRAAQKKIITLSKDSNSYSKS